MIDGNEAEEFIQAVRRAAFNENQDRNDEWMARFASTCISGKALRWYESLDDDVQESWKLLRKAILARYPPTEFPSDSFNIPSSSSASPAPAAPPPAPPTQPTSLATRSAARAARPPTPPSWPSSFPQVDFNLPSNPRPPPPPKQPPSAAWPSSFPQIESGVFPPGERASMEPPSRASRSFDRATGVIEVRYADSNRLMGYIGSTLTENGVVQVTRTGLKSGQRFGVKAPSSASGPAQLYLVTESRYFYKLLGMTWLDPKSDRASTGYRYAGAIVTGSMGQGSSAQNHIYEGATETAIWDINSNGTMSATSGVINFTFCVYAENDQLNLFPDIDAYRAARGSGQWVQVLITQASTSNQIESAIQGDLNDSGKRLGEVLRSSRLNLSKSVYLGALCTIERKDMDDRQDGNEAEEFVQAVRRAAFNANQDRNDEWMARFASTCMSGKALRWFESLGDDVQESWKLLRKAILAQYPPSDESSLVPSASGASPAPAAPPPASVAPVAPPPAASAWPTSFPQVDRDPLSDPGLQQQLNQLAASLWPASFPQVDIEPPQPQRALAEPPSQSRGNTVESSLGVIEVRDVQSDRLMGYISRDLRDNGAVQVTRKGLRYAQKFTVVDVPAFGRVLLSLVAPTSFTYKFLSLTWLDANGVHASPGYRYGAAVFSWGTDGSRSSAKRHIYGGPGDASIWNVDAKGTLSARAKGKNLSFYIYADTDQLNLFPDFNAYTAARGVAHQWDQVKLVFKQD
ncbi:hypothetical protein FRB90_003077 [Tulasnella sp. 427]|nr:hypothetical protein FRB90_003077 [Tulasnella sp. 427]